jgi:hypothetical protein
MATRQERLDAFPSKAERPAGQPFELLCEDHIGTYVLPFLCHWTDDAWRSIETGTAVDAVVVGWRAGRVLDTEERK